MNEFTFSRVAPVIPVANLKRALRRYRMLGFSVRSYGGPAEYGYVERDGVELHVSESPDHDRHHGAEVYLFVSDADAVYAAWLASGVKGRFIRPHDTDYGVREFAFVDRDGTAHRVGSPPTQNGRVIGHSGSEPGE